MCVFGTWDTKHAHFHDVLGDHSLSQGEKKKKKELKFPIHNQFTHMETRKNRKNWNFQFNNQFLTPEISW